MTEMRLLMEAIQYNPDGTSFQNGSNPSPLRPTC